MREHRNSNDAPHDNRLKLVLTEHQAQLLKDLRSLSGGELLNRILDSDKPRTFVQELPAEDFFWLVKKVGEEDCLPLLELASVEQWRFLLDLEIWERDRLDLAQTTNWMTRLQLADPRRLARWLLNEGESLAYYYLFRSVQVVIVSSKDEVYDLPEGFFSLDGIIHIRVIDPDNRENMEKMIRAMAGEDFSRYQSMALGLAGVLPAELEEQMYRLRNVRLAEHGFLPREEAVSVYAPLNSEETRSEEKQALSDILLDDQMRSMVPLSPLLNVGAKNMLSAVLSRISDPLLMDRIRLEFAGLCNQIMSADALTTPDMDVLVRTCRKAAGYLSMAIEKLTGRDTSSAERLLRDQPLVSLFRMGFGLALKVKWEAERWLKGSWFSGRGFKTDFWGEYWGGTLAGLLAESPRFYVGAQGEEEYREFEWLSEIAKTASILRSVMVLDSLLERLADIYGMETSEMLRYPTLTFRSLLFNFWARSLLKLNLSFSSISREDAKQFFKKLRAKERKPPYTMSGFKEVFIEGFMDYASNSDAEAASVLRETLISIWEEFREENELVSEIDLDARYSKFISVKPSAGTVLH